jgi:hypothetical protein
MTRLSPLLKSLSLQQGFGHRIRECSDHLNSLLQPLWHLFNANAAAKHLPLDLSLTILGECPSQ